MKVSSEIRNLILLWVAAIALALLSAASLWFLYDPAAATLTPAQADPTTDWISSPATTSAQLARLNVVITTALITPFLYGPILTVLYIIWNHNSRRRPVAAPTRENVPLEIAWTITPAIVLAVMAIPAYPKFKYMETMPENPDVVVDVTGMQFYWQYELPKYGVALTDDGTGEDPLFLPVNQQVLLNGNTPQVNHAWWVPAFGVKFDVIPGRITQGWFQPLHEGFFKGQCAELCGAQHARMYIHVKVVDEAEFYEWLHSKGATFPPDEYDKVLEYLGPDALPDGAETASTAIANELSTEG